jgi:hypothetical protein
VESSNLVIGGQNYSTLMTLGEIHEGVFYYEVIPTALPPSSNMRVGISNSNLNNVLECPVGIHASSYSYRISDGCVFNNRRSAPFGNAVALNQTLGVLVHLPYIHPPI